ncbi:MAG: glycoside hydrolase family 88 protein [Moheibacter sp.]
MIFSLFLILLFFILFLPDFLVNFMTWQSRIKIGRWKDKDTWQTAVQKKAAKWLNHTPTVKLTDQNRLILIDMLKGKYRRSTIQQWQQASLVLGLSDQYRKTKNQKIKKQLSNFVENITDSNGNWKEPIKECDGSILAYSILQLPDLDIEKLKPAFDQVWELLMSLKGDDGCVAYKSHMLAYRYVDTIGFICPFLVAYGQKFNQPEAVNLAIRQIDTYRQFGFIEKTGLPVHAYSTENSLPLGQFGWGRGLGWYAIGLADSWKELDDSHPMKTVLSDWINEFTETVLRFQRNDGSWGWMVQHPKSRSDSSATAILAYFLKIAKIAGCTDQRIESSIEKAVAYLMKVSRRDGTIDFSQGDTKGIGVYSMNFDRMPFTQGFGLRI